MLSRKSALILSLSAFFLLYGSFGLCAQEKTPTGQPVEASDVSAATRVKAGMFITNLYDFEMSKRSFNVIFWQWFLHDNEKYSPLESAEIVNAKNFAMKFPSTIHKDDVKWGNEKKRIYWVQGKYSATIEHNWDVTRFPFDTQVLNIFIEDAIGDITQTVFEADKENSRLDEAVKIPGWTIDSFEMKTSETVVNSTFGDPTLQGGSRFSRVAAAITIHRDGVRLLFSSFIGFFVASALIMLTFMMDINGMAMSRIGLSGGSIFAAIGNKYVVDNFLPPASSFTLADGIESSTFILIISSIVSVVIGQFLHNRKPAFAHRFNVAAGTLCAGAYFVFNGVMIYRAVTGGL